jgi:hypothetical protein
VPGGRRFICTARFIAMVGETPKQYTLRLRLERAAARLITSDDAVLDIALANGFNSHEVFTRAFRRVFGRTPAAYRAVFRRATAPVRRRHAAVVETSGPCVGLYHITVDSVPRRSHMPTLSIERRDLSPQPFLFVQAKAGRHEIAKAIAESLGKAFPYVMQQGLPIAGPPTARYLTMGPGLFDMQIGVPIAARHRVRATFRLESFPVVPSPSACMPVPTIRSARRLWRWNAGWSRTAIDLGLDRGNRT